MSDRLKLIAKVNRDEELIDLASNEAKRLASYNSRYIVRYYDSFIHETDVGQVFITIMEFCDGKMTFILIKAC